MVGGEHSLKISAPQVLWFGIDSALKIYQTNNQPINHPIIEPSRFFSQWLDWGELAILEFGNLCDRKPKLAIQRSPGHWEVGFLNYHSNTDIQTHGQCG